MRTERVIIIGAGPAGLAAAMQLKRQGITARVFEAERVGGLLHNANLVENYPGFPDGLPGPELAALMEEQAARIGVEITFEAAEQVDFADGAFHVRAGGEDYQCEVLVIATGTKPKTFDESTIPKGLRGRGFYEVYPLLEMEGRRIAIVGAGDAAFDYGLNLSRANEVLILNRGKEIACLGLLWERAQRETQIGYYERTAIREIVKGEGGGMRLACESPEGGISFEVDYLIGAIGREPRLEFMSEKLIGQSVELEQAGVLHLVGDVKNGLYRQTAIAVGDGIKAAMKIKTRLELHTTEKIR